MGISFVSFLKAFNQVYFFASVSTECDLSPTVFRVKNYRFFFFSKEERRMHVHVSSPEGEAKFWLEPVVALAHFTGLSPRRMKELQKIVEERNSEIAKAWKKHFKS